MATFVEQAKGPLIVIVGPTASGKTGLAVEFAEELGGEIICADSRTIYRGMDIGTAKPTLVERQRVPHWGLDLIEPGQPFSVADFKRYATGKIADIRARGKIPFLVGGSGLYVDAVIFDYQFGDKSTTEQRDYLEAMSLSELHSYCKSNNIPLPENKMNKRYVVRAIERQGRSSQRRSAPISTSIIVGIATETAMLKTRIADRSEQIFTNGVVEEAMILGKKYGWKNEAMTGNVYPLVHDYVKGMIDEVKLIEKFEVLDRQLVKRQLTWFRRNPYIVWETRENAEGYIKRALTLDVLGES